MDGETGADRSATDSGERGGVGNFAVSLKSSLKCAEGLGLGPEDVAAWATVQRSRVRRVRINCSWTASWTCVPTRTQRQDVSAR